MTKTYASMLLSHRRTIGDAFRVLSTTRQAPQVIQDYMWLSEESDRWALFVGTAGSVQTSDDPDPLNVLEDDPFQQAHYLENAWTFLKGLEKPLPEKVRREQLDGVAVSFAEHLTHRRMLDAISNLMNVQYCVRLCGNDKECLRQCLGG